MQDKSKTISVDVWLYGALARYGGESAGSAYARLQPELPDGSRLADLLRNLGLRTEERGITFLNGQLSALPGLQPDLGQPLHHGDRVAFFHLKSMWPFQYRDGAALAPGLARIMADKRSLLMMAKVKIAGGE